MPNAFAYFVLALWPLVCLAMFRKLPVERAVIWSILGGYLLLPPLAEFDLPLVPDMDKYAIANLSAFMIAVFYMGHRVSLWPTSWAARILVSTFVLGAIPTVLTNSDPIILQTFANSAPIVFKTGELPGLIWRDIFSVVSNQVIVLLPFFLGRHYLATDSGLRELLLALLIGGLAYSLPALFEIRLSPQLNIWIYGFFQHSFLQMMRDGGFRPIVFLPHALWLAFFFVMSLLAAAAFARHAAAQQRARLLFAVLYLGVVLLLCKSLASQLYAAALVPVVFLTGPRLQIALAVAIALVAVTYPMLRNLGVIPLDAILAQAEAISPDRAQSLGYRFDNEQQLLDRAREKYLFGWGGWGRNLIRDLETGRILSIPDGRWIITFGTYGWFGYLSEMGLLATPLVLLGWRTRKLPANARSPFAAPIALILAVTLVDMLLNSTLIPFTWMIAGAILGYAETLGPRGRTDIPASIASDGPVIGRKTTPSGKRTVL